MKLCLKCKSPIILDHWYCSHCKWHPVECDGFLDVSETLSSEREFFDQKAFHKLFAIEDAHFWFRARNQLILWALEKYFPKAKNILEIGCGTGYVISAIQKKFPQLSIHAADIYKESLPFVRSRVGNGATILRVDGRALPYKEEFDLIGAFDILEHVVEDECMIKEIYRSLKNGGGAILTVPQHPILWSRTDEMSCHVRRYKTSELQDKLLQQGFRIVFSTSFVVLLFPLLVFSRLKSKKKLSTAIEQSKYRIINQLLEKILAFEHRLVRMGVCFPFGGSRLVVVTKGPNRNC